MLPQIEFIYFDVGRVLLHRQGYTPAIHAERLGLSVTDVDAARRRVLDTRTFIPGWMELGTVERETEWTRQVCIAVLEELGREVDPELVDWMVENAMRRDYLKAEQLHETLDYLGAKYRLGILSNAAPSRRFEMADHDLLRQFDPIVISGEVYAEKPGRRIYEIGLEQAGVDGAKVAFVDDVPENLEMAREVGYGMPILLDPTGANDTDFMTIKQLSELMEIL